MYNTFKPPNHLDIFNLRNIIREGKVFGLAFLFKSPWYCILKDMCFSQQEVARLPFGFSLWKWRADDFSDVLWGHYKRLQPKKSHHPKSSFKTDPPIFEAPEIPPTLFWSITLVPSCRFFEVRTAPRWVDALCPFCRWNHIRLKPSRLGTCDNAFPLRGLECR